jgi:hypothetical protein
MTLGQEEMQGKQAAAIQNGSIPTLRASTLWGAQVHLISGDC